jgi:hypothetical protein
MAMYLARKEERNKWLVINIIKPVATAIITFLGIALFIIAMDPTTFHIGDNIPNAYIFLGFLLGVIIVLSCELFFESIFSSEYFIDIYKKNRMRIFISGWYWILKKQDDEL